MRVAERRAYTTKNGHLHPGVAPAWPRDFAVERFGVCGHTSWQALELSIGGVGEVASGRTFGGAGRRLTRRRRGSNASGGCCLRHPRNESCRSDRSRAAASSRWWRRIFFALNHRVVSCVSFRFEFSQQKTLLPFREAGFQKACAGNYPLPGRLEFSLVPWPASQDTGRDRPHRCVENSIVLARFDLGCGFVIAMSVLQLRAKRSADARARQRVS